MGVFVNFIAVLATGLPLFPDFQGVILRFFSYRYVQKSIVLFTGDMVPKLRVTLGLIVIMPLLTNMRRVKFWRSFSRELNRFTVEALQENEKRLEPLRSEKLEILTHHGRVWDGLANVRGAAVVKDDGLLNATHLQTLHAVLVRGRFGLIGVLIKDNLFIALKEVLLESHCVDHGCSFVPDVWHEAIRRHVSVPRPNLEITRLEVALYALIRCEFNLRVTDSAPVLVQALYNLVEPGRCCSQVYVRSVVVLTSRHIG